MKLVLLSDLHITSVIPIARKDDVLKTGLKKLEYVLKYASRHNATILQAGDFCNKARDWVVLFELSKLLSKYQVPIYAIQGQHDYYYRSNPDTNPTTMGMLCYQRLVKIIYNKYLLASGSESCHIYPVHWGDTIPDNPTPSNCNILLAHAPISPIRVFPRQKVTTQKEFLKLHKAWDLVVLGDIHRWFESSKGKSHIVNTGSMMRLEATEYNMTHKPCFYVYDTVTKVLIRKIIPHKPAEEVIQTSHIKPETEEEHDDYRINELATAMQETFTDDPKKKELMKILSEKKVSKSVRNIIMDALDKVTEKDK